VIGVITAVHLLLYSDDATATRAFFQDVLRWPFVSEGENGDDGVGGAGTGGDDPAQWLIFGTGPSELGVHPTAGVHQGTPWTSPRKHQIAVMCDDLDATVADLASRGATFAGEATELGFGRGVMLHVPGADDLLLYQAHHAIAHGLPPRANGVTSAP
jgi:catechol 2,3-dioxygenase-like lactoylglutathione lyase family enzyme